MNRKLALVLFILSAVYFLKPTQGFASSFTNNYVRLDSQKASAPLSGTLCAEPSSAGTGSEDSITIAFPSDFSLSTNTSDWTTNTANLPAGTTIWPLIGSGATSVSGQSVTFASSDLNSNLLYCFNFNANASTTGTSGDNKMGDITTKNASNSIIDFSDYAVSILDNNQIGVSASIEPQISDLPISIESLTPGTQFPQNTTISYKITYGSNTPGAIPLTIQAAWSQGTIEGSPSPSVDILDYVVGSATNAYNSTPPVIDTVNKTITWTINSFPGNTTNKTVTFSLKTNDFYTGSSLVDFTVAARAISDTTVTPDQSVDQKYLFLASSTPTPTPTLSPTSATSTTPTPTPQESASLAFTEISIRSVSSSDANIFVSTNNDSKLNLQYGTSIDSFSKTVKTSSFDSQNLIALSGLSPDTDYFFRLKATDVNGNSISSDIFTFRTAIASKAPSIIKESLVATSNNNIIINSAILQALKIDKNIILVPVSSEFEIQFALNKNTPVKSIQVLVRNKNVLGFSTIEKVDASSNFAKLVEIQPGVYVGKLMSQSKPGLYEIYVRIIDYNGNITEEKIADLKVTSKFQIFKKGTTNQPVENVRALLYLYNDQSKTYELISPQVLPIQNPAYSLPDGTFNLVLPYGKYRVDLSNIGYEATTVEFIIDPYSRGYPTIYMKEEPFSIISAAQYYWEIFTDALSASQAYIIAHSDSSRLFDISAMGTIFIFVLISILSISARTHVSVFYLPYFLIFKLTIMLKKNKNKLIYGKVIDSNANFPVSRARVYLTSADGQRVISSLKTNKLGEFYYNNSNQENYKIKIVKEGFISPPPYSYKSGNKLELPILLPIKKQEKPGYSLIEVILIYSEDLLGMCMEALLLFALVIQVYFIFTFGFLRIAPFILITILNLMLVFSYLYKPKGLKT
jgi:hypothetical protein